MSTHTTRAAPARTTRTVLRVTTLAACVPYLTLKIAWIAGSRIGIPEGSALRRDGNSLMALNALTVLMDAAVIALAFLLTRPWGQRVPSWLLALPMWCATGLLAPIVAVFPAQTLAAAVRGGPPGAGGGSPDAQLAPWVWSLVYTGFLVQALALGTLFVLYARERWAPLWRGRIGTLPDSPTRSARRLTAAAVAVLSLLPAATHLLWASGSTTGLNPARAAATGPRLPSERRRLRPLRAAHGGRGAGPRLRTQPPRPAAAAAGRHLDRLRCARRLGRLADADHPLGQRR
ncbi:hypothetical protein [Streptomyces lydicus]|uniref:hypothetical protein n=1 Tax=Streptomyces lydicus TaxID=47763 RepID=UPI0037BD4056